MLARIAGTVVSKLLETAVSFFQPSRGNLETRLEQERRAREAAQRVASVPGADGAGAVDELRAAEF